MRIILSLRKSLHGSSHEAMGFFSRIVSAGKAQEKSISHRSGKRIQNLVHIFVFDSSEDGLGKPRQVHSLVRSVIPESLAYAGVPVSLFIDHDMPSSIGHGMTRGSDSVAKYAFAWKKIHETYPSFDEAFMPRSENYSFSCEEYERGKGHRGVVLAIYELSHVVKNASGDSISE